MKVWGVAFGVQELGCRAWIYICIYIYIYIHTYQCDMYVAYGLRFRAWGWRLRVRG